MNSHSKIFSEFVDDLNKSSVRYVIIRGFRLLPEYPDTDIDIVPILEDKELFHTIALRHLIPATDEVAKNYGFAEYSEMSYQPYFTPGDSDSSIHGGRFRVDAYSSLFFLSPYKGFTTFWTVPKKFHDYVFATRIGKYNFFIPSIESEITLLLLRNLLDQHGHWKEKHKVRIGEILPHADQEILLNTVSAALPYSDKLCELLNDSNYDRMFDVLMDRSL